MLFPIIIIVYLLAVNFYGFLLVKSGKNEDETTQSTKVGDGKLFLAGFLGGATAIYLCMFLFKFRLRNLFLMIVMPVLAVLNLYLIILAFRSGFFLLSVQ